MELVDRYLKTVGKCLPEAQREDILKEISDDIRSEMEDKESELGRPLTEAEQEALLKRRGNPVLMASRYREGQGTLAFGRQLIGPVLFPFYTKVLAFNLGITFIVLAAIFTALVVGGQKVSVHDIVSTCLLQLFIQLGVVTLIFWLIDKHLARFPDRWSVRRPSGGLGLDLNLGLEKNIKQVSRFESVSILIATAVALVWLRETQRHAFLVLGPAAYFLRLAPIWYQIYIPGVVIMLAEVMRAGVNLARPDWVRFRAIAQVGIHSAGLTLMYFLIKAGRWVMTADGSTSQGVTILNQIIFYSLLLGAVISAVQLSLRVLELIRQGRGQRSHVASPAA